MFTTGIIEGFYGNPWTWEQRQALLPFLAQQGYRFFLYAPKADHNLRSRWREPYLNLAPLKQFARACSDHGIKFGVGLSPLNLHAEYAGAGRDLLMARVEELGHFDWLALLFDDMRGDLPDLASTQGQIVTDVQQNTDAKLLMCPSYYSTSAILDKVFGQRPERYLEDLGQALPEGVDVFWTGQKVCSTEYPADHLRSVAQQLGRAPFLWDNYPVNDGPRMCKHLHLRPFSGRGPQVRQLCAGLAVNPMNQAWLSRLVLASLGPCLDGNPSDTLDQLLPAGLARILREDVDSFQDGNLDDLDTERFLVRYADFDHPAAEEVRGWLRGEYVVGPECLTDE